MRSGSAPIRLVVRDLTVTPGARYYSDGNFSGEWFYKEHLRPAFNDAIERSCELIVDLDGTYGYATSFLEQAFGQLAIDYTPAQVRKILNIVSDDEPGLIAEVLEYIADVQPSAR